MITETETPEPVVDGPKYPDVVVQLTGVNGNAYVIMAHVANAMKAARIPREEIDAYYKEATAGNYDQLLQTTMRWVTTK